jgi:tartrate-resistant acid phosphatase type 5
MTDHATLSRRRAIQTLFCSSAALALNLRALAQTQVSASGLHFFCIGDFGTGGADQKKVSAAMQGFIAKHNLKPDALLCLGDNFYSKDKSPAGFTIESPRWKNEIEDMYPAASFPGPIYGVLGNHDYHDNAGGQDVQLAYSKKSGTRWKMPAKWFRLDLGGEKPLVTVLCLDSNLPAVSGGVDKKTRKPRASLTAAEEQEQLAWLENELKKSRAPFTLVVAHHPLYSNGDHGDTKALISQWEGLFQQHKVHAYLCGHDHDLQHLELEGRYTSHILSGGGGAKTREMEVTHKAPFGRQTHGFTHLHISGDAMRFTHYDADGAQLHTFAKKQDGKVVIG